MLKFERKKKRNILLSILYRLDKLPFAGNKTKLKLFLDLEWIFHRLAIERAHKYYKASEHPLRKQQKKAIMSFIKEDQAVLDLGSRYGHISDFIAEKAKLVVGIDHDAGAVELANRQYKRPNLQFHVGDAIEYLEKNTQSFDVLILSHILEHLDKPEEFLMQFKKYFKYIYVDLPDFERYYANSYRQDLEMSLVYSDNDHIHEWDRESLIAMFKRCGLEIISSTYIFGNQTYWLKT